MKMLERFLNEKVNKYGKELDHDTKIAYEYDITQFMEYADKPESEITYNDISKWFGCYRKKYSTATMARKIMALKSYFRWLKAIGAINENPTEDFQTFTPQSKEKVPLSIIEINEMIKQSKNSRDKAIIETLAFTGMRISELIDMKLSDMDEDEVIIHGKGGKVRTIFLSEKVRSAIEDYIVDRKQADIDNIFISNNHTKMTERTINNLLKSLARRAGIERWETVSPHLFRATYASLLAEKNVPVPTIQKILGHTLISTTMIYIKTNQSQVKNAMCMDIC